MRERILTAVAIFVLTLLLALTLMPLFLMFYTSVKPAGTLTRQVSEIAVADFEIGELNSIGGPMEVKATGENSSVAMNFIPAKPESRRDRILQISYASTGEGRVQWWTRLTQDMRKFDALEFSVRGELGGESFTIDLVDPKGRRASIPIQQYLRGGVRPGWARVRIPMEHFPLALLTPGRTERTAEDMALSFDSGSGTIYLNDVKLVFKKWTLNNYYDVIVSGPFGRYFFNSLIISLVITFSNLLFSSMVGYAFARREFPGKRTMFMLILGSIMIPPQVMMVPIFILMKHMNWLNTY
ncbi:MAG: carbohydrate ABC transporter permease, partial [Candidatus Omnitrophica bacterium]|nr:carbohydrate ABC transporter permease [Candidatus Omnitrophota bacterium]